MRIRNNGTDRNSHLDFLISAGETITGLIIATALIYPDKKLESVELSSVLKRMKKKDFARNVNRETIELISHIQMPVDDFIAIALDAMKKNASQLGL